jgi:RNA recognition motif-containing protein
VTFHFSGVPENGCICHIKSPGVCGSYFFFKARKFRINRMKMYVGNLPFSMDEENLRTLFGEFGDVDSINVIVDRETGRSRGFAFVEMQDEEARKAIDALHEKQFDGRALKVNEAQPRQNRGGGGGGRGPGRGRY